MDDDAPTFADFWTASSLTPVDQRAFAERMAAADPIPPGVHPWARPGTPHPLAPADGQLRRLTATRRSGRRFSDAALPRRAFEALLGSIAAHPDGHRPQPSAGGFDCCGVSVVLFHVDHPLNGRIAQHHPVQHALYEIGPCLPWSDLREALAGQDAEGEPAALLVIMADPSRVLAKYGERGGRFVLLEAGAMLQTLSLAVAELGLAGYALGGCLDDRLTALTGHRETGALAVAALGVGVPKEE